MAVNMNLKIPGVNGESVISGFEKQIDILAWSWGGTQSGTMHIAQGGGSGKVSFQDLSITKWVDTSTPQIMMNLASGKHFPGDTILSVSKASGEGKPLLYLTITMTDTLITSYTTGGSGGEDRVTENITLNFAEVKFKYVPQSKSGGGAGNAEFGWKIAKNEVK